MIQGTCPEHYCWYVQDSVDLEKVGSLTKASPATAALFAGFLPSAQVSPKPFPTPLHCPAVTHTSLFRIYGYCHGRRLELNKRGPSGEVQVLPAPLYMSPPQLSALSPLPFATLHRPESAQRPSSVPSVLSTPRMISLAFAGARRPTLEYLKCSSPGCAGSWDTGLVWTSISLAGL